MFTLLAIGLHVGLREYGLVSNQHMYIPIFLGLIWDGMFITACLKILIKL